MSNQVFISYHKDDSEAVYKLHEDLQKRGIRTWIDIKCIRPGQRQSKTIYTGIISSDIFIACLSPKFTDNEFCRTQLFLARAYNKKILPIIINSFSIDESSLHFELNKLGQNFKYSLRGLDDIHILDFSENYSFWGEGSYERNFEKLVETILPTPKPAALNSGIIYISFGSKDYEFALQLAKNLELARGKIWFYQLSTKPGDDWRQAMLSGLQSASHFVIFLSPQITKSENIKHELLMARIRDLPIYPLVSEGTFGDKKSLEELRFALKDSYEMNFLNDFAWFTPDPDSKIMLENLKQALGLIETGKPPKNGIFISYRRADTQAATGRIREKLVERFGAETVFMDVDSIPPGEDFATYYREWLTNRAAVVLIMIGEKWTSLKTDPNQDEHPRLFSPTDHVRIEAETALGMSDLRVIPVLVGDASMPRQKDLPEGLHGLTRLNACKVRYDPDFSSDMKNLIASIESLQEA